MESEVAGEDDGDASVLSGGGGGISLQAIKNRLMIVRLSSEVCERKLGEGAFWVMGLSESGLGWERSMFREGGEEGDSSEEAHSTDGEELAGVDGGLSAEDLGGGLAGVRGCLWRRCSSKCSCFSSAASVRLQTEQW